MPTASFRIVSSDATGKVTDIVNIHVLKNGLLFRSKSQILPRYFQFILTYTFSIFVTLIQNSSIFYL